MAHPAEPRRTALSSLPGREHLVARRIGWPKPRNCHQDASVQVRGRTLHRRLGHAACRRQALQADAHLARLTAEPDERQLKDVGGWSRVVADEVDHQRIEHVAVE